MEASELAATLRADPAFRARALRDPTGVAAEMDLDEATVAAAGALVGAGASTPGEKAERAALFALLTALR